MTRAGLGLIALLAALAPGPSFAGNDTYCVAAPGPFLTAGECGSDAVVAMHDRWHFHMFVTDGAACYQCFDERDNTCETDFLRTHPGWLPASGKSCAVLGGPEDASVRFHVIRGQDVAAPLTPPSARPVFVTTEVSPRTRGPYAVGDEVVFDVRVQVGPGELRPFDQGTLVLTDARAKEELARLPVTNLGDGRGEVRATLPRAGSIRATFEVGQAGLRAGEQETRRDITKHMLEVGACHVRVSPSGRTGALFLGGDLIEVTGAITDGAGAPLPPTALSGRTGRVVLQRADGSELTAPVAIDEGGLRGALVAPTLPGGTEAALVHLLVDGEPAVCAGAPVSVTLSHLPLSLTATAPPVCWTERDCGIVFDLGRPSGGAAQARAQELLDDPGLEVLARLGGQRVTPRRAGDRFTVSVVPTAEGRVHAELELLWSGARSLRAEAGVDVRESIALVLPDAVDLGEVSGAVAIEETCVPLSFAGGKGALGAAFAVELAEPCGSCEATLVSAVGGQVYELPLSEIVVGADRALPLCLRVARCPTGSDGGSLELVVRPTEPLFAGQVRRVRVDYRVASRGALDCWGWLLPWLLGLVVAVFVVLGFVRPVGFEPGSAVRIAGSEKGLQRAPRLLLEEQPGGRPGWYRSARVHIDPGGAATHRSRSALMTFVPSPGGVAVRSSTGLLRQDRRTRKMDPVDGAGQRGGAPLQRGRVHQVGDLWLKVGG